MAEHKSTLVIDVKGNATARMKGLDKATKDTTKSASTLGSTFKLIGAAAAAAGIGAVASSILKAGVAMQQTEVAFGTMLGSMEKGKAVIKDLNQFANVTPFNNSEVIKSGRILLTAGIQADKLTDSLKAVGDVAAGTNQPLNEMAAIYAKALNKGKLQAEELNQLSERGVPILKTLANHYGTTTAEILKMGSQGKLTGVDLKRSFAQMTDDGGMFFNMMDKQSKTVGGRWSTLMGTLELLAIKIGTALLPVMEKVVTVLQNTVKWISENLDLIKSISIALAIVGGLWLTYVAVVEAAAVAQAALNIVMLANPIGLIIVAVASLTAALVFLIHHIDDFKLAWVSAEAAFDRMGKNITKFVDEVFQPFINAWSELKKGNISNAATQLKLGFSVNSGQIMEGVEDTFNATFKRGTLDRMIQETRDRAKADLALPTVPGGLNTSGLPKSGGVDVGKASSTAGKVQGSKQTHININLNNLVEEFNVTTQNMTEGATQVKDRMIEALLQVLNESDRLAKV